MLIVCGIITAEIYLVAGTAYGVDELFRIKVALVIGRDIHHDGTSRYLNKDIVLHIRRG